MTNFNKLTGAIKFALFVGTASLATSGIALAQDQDQTEDAPQTEAAATTLDRIEVTGSRLKRAEIEGAVPVIVISREQLDASGDVSVADVLRDSTFASFGNFRPQSGSSAQSLASIDLRGLGSGRTLVLIDGRRAPTAPQAAASGADVNAIPLAAVERIEILSDGASAIYGSDAIGGVVNIILRKDFNGVELRYGLQQTAVKGGDIEEASVTFGVSGDRGRLIGGVGTMDRENVYTRDQIGYVKGQSIYGNNAYAWDLEPGEVFDGNWDELSGHAISSPGYACDDEGFFFTSTGLCSYDFNAVAANQASIGNKSLFLLGDYQINDDWSVYSNATVTRVSSFGRYAPAPGLVTVGDGTPQDINWGTTVRDDPNFGTGPVATDGLPTHYLHRFAAAGNRDDEVNSINTDFLLGFQGQLSDSVGVDFGIRRTNYRVDVRGNGYVVASLAGAAGEDGSYDFADPYGADQATLQGFTATISRFSEWKSEEMYGLVNFDLFEMGGGMSNAVVGAEYREDKFVDQYDSLSEAGVIIGSAGSSSAGERSVGAAYFEWLLPIATTFDITLAGRYDQYSDYGNDFSPKIAARWQPLDNLTFRGSFGQGFRAPALNILSAKTAFSAEPVRDPQTCLALGAPETCQVQVNTFYVANPDLTSEQSDQFSVGAVWDATSWLDMSLDYYNIQIEDTIGSISPTAIINSAADPATFGPIPPGLSITRNATTGRITEIIAGYANRGALETDGLDFRLNTDFDLGEMGRLQNRLQVSYTNKYEIEAVSGVTDYIGLLGQPQTRANLQTMWSIGDFTVNYGINYIEGQSDSSGQVGGYATNDLQVAWEAPWNAQVTIGATNVGDRYPELVAYDGRPWNMYLYDAYGRTTYMRYTQRF